MLMLQNSRLFSKDKIIFLSYKEAYNIFAEAMSRSLSVVAVCERKEPENDSMRCSPDLRLIKVNCMTSDLNIDWSFNFLTDFTYFGGPTSPVSSCLPPGYVKFVGYNSLMYVEDRTIFDVGVTTKCNITSF